MKELAEKELQVKEAVILDERGVDISSMHPEDLVFAATNASALQWVGPVQASQQPQSIEQKRPGSSASVSTFDNSDRICECRYRLSTFITSHLNLLMM